MSMVIAILGIQLLVVVHEAGHFLMARAVGMRPQRFYIGFPPAIFKFERNGVEYGLGALPLGGFVNIPGMNRPVAPDLDLYLGPAVREAPELAGPAEAVKRALGADDHDALRAALPHLELLLDEARLSKRTERKARRGLKELHESVAGAAYWQQPVPKRIAVILAGPFTNVVLALALFTALLTIGSGGYRLGFVLGGTTEVTNRVDSVLKGYPAARAGLKPGDRILAIDGKAVSAGQIHDAIGSSRGRPLRLAVDRHGRRIAIGPVRAKHEPRLSVGAAAWQSVLLSGDVLRGTGQALAGLVRGKSDKKVGRPVGIVGIVQESSSAAEAGVQPYLSILGLVSLSLGLFNLLPFLPLDGGHILIASIEGIRRRALPRVFYERFFAVGLTLILILSFIALTSDITHLGGG